MITRATQLQRESKSPFGNTYTAVPNGLLQRKCACGNHTVAGGECEECRKKKQISLQTKLRVNEPGDIYEREADRIANEVMVMPVRPNVGEAPLRIQRLNGELTGQTETAPTSVKQALASPGRPLEPALRQDMEQRFGYDFSQVRVQTGAAAEQSARDVNALAYTVRQNVVFDTGCYAPDTIAGKRLLAHELTHTIQHEPKPSASSQISSTFVPSTGPERLFRVVNYIEEVTGREADRYLARFDGAVEEVARVISSVQWAEADDLRGALERLRTLRREGRVTCWYTSGGLNYASWHAASGQIRLHVYFAQSTLPSTILHEAIHALHAQRYRRLNQLYAEVLAAGGTRREQIGVLLLKWKAWTEYWAYRRGVEYDNLRQTDPSFRRDAHQAAMAERDVRESIIRVREAIGQDFDPSSWNPPRSYRTVSRRR